MRAAAATALTARTEATAPTQQHIPLRTVSFKPLLGCALDYLLSRATGPHWLSHFVNSRLGARYTPSAIRS